jgi:ATP-dependent RNA helicase DBP3
VNVLREAGQIVPEALMKFGTHVKKKVYIYLFPLILSFGSPLLGISFTPSKLQESKLYGAHFKEIPIDAPKSKKITFDNSDDDD